MKLPNKFATCPTCDYLLNGAIPLDGNDNIKPKEGDVTICAKCGEILEYEEGFFLKKVEGERLFEIMQYDFQTYTKLKFLSKELPKLYKKTH